MIKNLNVITCLFCISLLATSCKSYDSKQGTINKVTIEVYTQQLGTDPQETFPDEFKILALPFNSDVCDDGTSFYAVDAKSGIKVRRIDLNLESEIIFDLSSSLGKGVSQNESRIKRRIDDQFPSIMIGKVFTQPNQNIDFSKLENCQDRVVILSEVIESDSVEIAGHFFPVFKEMNSVKRYIADDLCKRRASNKNATNYAVLYNIDINKQQSFWKLMGEAEYDEIKSQNIRNENNPPGLIQIDSALNNYDADKDYRVYYLKSQNNIYGKHHIKSFQYLIEAARIAIKTGNRIDMLGDMEQDENDAMWKLAHGHDDIWLPVVNSLTRNDVSILNSINLVEEAEEHHEELTPIEHHH